MIVSLLVQCLTVSRLGLLGIKSRLWSSAVIIVGMACVVGVLLSMLSITAGLLRASRIAGDSTHAIVLAADSQGEFGSGISRGSVETILNGPGIGKRSDGHPLGDGEFLFWTPPAAGFTGGSLYVRGIGPAGLLLRPRFRVVAGRMFQPGRQEVIIGANASEVFGLRLGMRVILPGGEWPIVGVFSAGGSIEESELMTDADTLMSAAQLSSFGSVLVALKNVGSFEQLKKWISKNPALLVTVERQSDYYIRTADETTAFFTTLALSIGAIMAIGALFGSVKITYTATTSRGVEISTLRAIGYTGLPVAVSVVMETIVLSLLGAAVGACVAWLLFDGRHISYFRNVFELSIPPGLIALAFGLAFLIALVGGLPPAARAVRQTVTSAFRVI
jgi:putative ABC transport system permease protein